MKAILAHLGSIVSAIIDRILSEPVMDLALLSDLLVIGAAVRAHQPVSDALILDVAQTLLALVARSKVTPVRNLPASIPPAAPAA